MWVRKALQAGTFETVARHSPPCRGIVANAVLYRRAEQYEGAQNALQELREKRSKDQIEIEKLDQIKAGIESLNGTGTSHTTAQTTRKKLDGRAFANSRSH